MAVTVVKKSKAAKAEKTKTKTEGIIARVNDLGDLYVKMRPLEDKVTALKKEWKPLFSEIQEFVDESNEPDAEVTLKSDKYAATFTKHGKTNAVNDAKACFDILEEIQEGLGWELMTFGVTELKKYLSPMQLEKVLKENPAGRARSVKVAKLEE